MSLSFLYSRKDGLSMLVSQSTCREVETYLSGGSLSGGSQWTGATRSAHVSYADEGGDRRKETTESSSRGLYRRDPTSSSPFGTSRPPSWEQWQGLYREGFTQKWKTGHPVRLGTPKSCCPLNVTFHGLFRDLVTSEEFGFHVSYRTPEQCYVWLSHPGLTPDSRT